MGYAKPEQKAGGIHTRLRSRAFVFAEEANPSSRVAYVALDAGMSGTLLTSRVVSDLPKKFGADLYTYSNVCISGSHTHSTPGGFLQYVLYDVTSCNEPSHNTYINTHTCTHTHIHIPSPPPHQPPPPRLSPVARSPDAPTDGFVKQSLDALVLGVVNSIARVP